MSIRFAELPAGRTSTEAWGEESAELRANTGKWAHFPDFDDRSSGDKGAFAQNIKRAKVKAFRPEGAFEARVIKGQLWVRFVGESK